MAKISPTSIKYMIYASFEAHGPLEKPDVVGALFGQTEGLLGGDMEMRELQKEGKIGRIEVSLQIVDGKTVGEIQVPTAMDKSETTLIAAALETIDKIGPTEAEIKIDKIQDVRADKRNFIMERAKKLLENIESGGSFGELAQSLKENSRIEKIQEYGEEKLPAGDISGNEIIVVEGRADVVNLLKNRISNVIGMDGAKLPKEIAKLGEQKELTLFIDGDRGGKLIAKNVIGNAKIAYVAIAPDGKEVEELAGKEILLSLRKRVPVNNYLKQEDFNGRRNGGRQIDGSGRGIRANSYSSSNVPSEKAELKYSGDVKKRIREVYEGMKGNKSAALLDENLDVRRRVGSREIVKAVQYCRKPVLCVIVDGNATRNLVKACEEKGVKYLAAKNFNVSDETDVDLISL